MTKIKCDYKKNPSHNSEWIIKSMGKQDPVYCDHRAEDGSCTLDEIEIGEEDSGWVATCDNMLVLEEWVREEQP